MVMLRRRRRRHNASVVVDLDFKHGNILGLEVHTQVVPAGRRDGVHVLAQRHLANLGTQTPKPARRHFLGEHVVKCLPLRPDVGERRPLQSPVARLAVLDNLLLAMAPPVDDEADGLRERGGDGLNDGGGHCRGGHTLGR